MLFASFWGVAGRVWVVDTPQRRQTRLDECSSPARPMGRQLRFVVRVCLITERLASTRRIGTLLLTGFLVVALPAAARAATYAASGPADAQAPSGDQGGAATQVSTTD